MVIEWWMTKAPTEANLKCSLMFAKAYMRSRDFYYEEFLSKDGIRGLQFFDSRDNERFQVSMNQPSHIPLRMDVFDLKLHQAIMGVLFIMCAFNPNMHIMGKTEGLGLKKNESNWELINKHGEEKTHFDVLGTRLQDFGFKILVSNPDNSGKYIEFGIQTIPPFEILD